MKTADPATAPTATTGSAGTAARGSRPARRRILRIGPWVAVPVRGRSVVVAAVSLLLLLVAAVATLSLGRLGIDLPDLPSALAGDATGKNAFVLNRLRGPRLVVAIATGAAFGLSGALFQSVTRNPLGSPDVIGLGAGAGAGAAAAALFLPDVLPVAVGALLGAVLAMAVVFLSTGTGFRSPGRLVVAGIGVAAMATALTQYVVYAVERDKASALTAYINGSLSARSWDDAATIWTVLLVCVPFAALLARPLSVGEMGDDLSTGLGARPGRTATWAVALSIVLSAGAVSVAGPIAFVSLTAPQIAKRVTRSGGPHLVMSTLLGALLLVLADLAAQQLPLFDDLPVGLYTMAVGGAYLGYLLLREWRRPAA
ncbi:iron chelate uptake ABC transporter family permease subunit [Streptomyces sp. NPDC002057]|uniref:FecCD family ABC transporter permease n=1 Tax=Streptomyces sp. NPDC002057 TaxID=3154664 RepID=UPI0033294512